MSSMTESHAAPGTPVELDLEGVPDPPEDPGPEDPEDPDLLDEEPELPELDGVCSAVSEEVQGAAG
jgi:hypothetical protein